MDIYEIRRSNLLLLIDEHANGNVTRFVEWTLNGSISYKGLQRVTTEATGPRKRRNLGTVLARRMEVQLKLPRGWMDHDHSGLIVKPGVIPNGRSERVMQMAEAIAALPPWIRLHIQKIVEALAARPRRVEP